MLALSGLPRGLQPQRTLNSRVKLQSSTSCAAQHRAEDRVTHCLEGNDRHSARQTGHTLQGSVCAIALSKYSAVSAVQLSDQHKDRVTRYVLQSLQLSCGAA